MTLNTNHAAIIVGAGPIGLACAISAKRRGIDPLVIDAGAIVESIVRYPIGMTFFTTPERLEIGGHPLVCMGAKATREEALKYYRGVVRAEGLNVRTYTRLRSARSVGGRVECELELRGVIETVTTDRLVLATGYFGQPNMLGVPGEELPHVSHYFDEPHLTFGQNIVVVGGKNSAVETALLCFRSGAKVTLVHRGTGFKDSVKFWLRPDFENRVAAGEITACLGCEVKAIQRDTILIHERSGTVREIPADRVYILTGYHPDFDLLRGIGILLEGPELRPQHDDMTLESNVPGVYLAGSINSGTKISEVFIENGRFDGEKIFGDHDSRRRAEQLYASSFRAIGE